MVLINCGTCANEEENGKCYNKICKNYSSWVKKDAEVVQDVEKSCETCKYGEVECYQMIGECYKFSAWQPIEQAEEKSCDNCKYGKSDICGNKMACDINASRWQPIEVIAGVGQDAPKTGTTEDATHYMQVGKQQPIETMQSTMNPEQFVGFLMGNIIKYALRMNHKNKFREDAGKCKQYAEWLVSAIDGEIIVAGKK